MMKFFSRFSLVALTLGMSCIVCACGQKGRLVVPVKPPAISTPYPTAMPKQNTENDSATEMSPDTTSNPTKTSDVHPAR